MTMMDRLRTFGETALFWLWAVPVTAVFTLYTFWGMAAARLKGEFFDEEESGEDWELLTAAWTGKEYRHEA